MRQLALDFPSIERDPRATHVEASCQKTAAAALAGWRDWPGGLLALVGGEGAGKSHLAALWMAQAGARPLGGGESLGDARGPLLVEDADRAPLPERRLLSLIDAARGGELGPVLFTARIAPALWPVDLPDLRSRLALAPAVAIADPTDEDLAAIFAKRLADRGAEAAPGVAEHVARRIERSLAAAGAVAALLDRTALERKARITRALVRDVLGELPGEEPEWPT